MGKPVLASCALIHPATVRIASFNTWRVRTFTVRSQVLHLLKARSIGLKSGKHGGSSCKKADLHAKKLIELTAGRPVATVAKTLGLDEATVYRYVRAFATLGVDQYLAHEQPGYWGLLTSAQWAHLCQQVDATLYTDSQNVRDWLPRTYQVHYSRSGLTALLYWMSYAHKLTTRVPC